MKTLLPFTSHLYLKRLARELNALPDGFYYSGLRYSAARFSRGTLQGYRPASFIDPNDPRKVNPWREIGTEVSDAYGRNVCASRS